MTITIEFANDKYSRLLTDARYDAGFSQAIVTAYRKKIGFLRSASDERDIRNMKSLHLGH